MALLLFGVALLIAGVRSDNFTELELCTVEGDGPWSRALEDWSISAGSGRHGKNFNTGRIMALPQSKGYYVSDRVETPFLSPPPPLYNPQGYAPPAQAMQVPHGYKEWEGKPSHPGNGKIVNRPPNKDKFAPSYPPQGHRPSIDRVDDPPRRQVTETDLYLLSAVEKLAHRADFMEKRLRRLEESLYHALQNKEPAPAPCPGNFTRVGSSCYSVSSSQRDWKDASLACRAIHAALLELADEKQKKIVLAWMLADTDRRGVDYWTGGLNPGLLWIWSHSARPVNGSVAGDGRCLAAVHDPALNTHVYRGRDCAARLHYICVKEDDGHLSNEVQRAARELTRRREGTGGETAGAGARTL
ncbi:uncharacterized protein LOC116766191 isoform X1 [Danaus plexippus]|uniref:uncharacterized protein LOC116766191 isoform X1 n=1 Tax=Danaus plexippus TaxID=13037 RepID=UPI002AB02E6B|nr:uncharacterized protein LOC116766191 isoform X1 [Danaus plexippus]